MSSEHAISPDVTALAKLLATEQANYLSLAIGELLQSLTPPRKVYLSPSDRWNGDYLAEVPTTTERPFCVVGAQLDRVRLTITNLGAAGTVWLSSTSSVRTGTGSYPLRPGSSLALETRAAVWALADATGSAIGWIIEEVDAS